MGAVTIEAIATAFEDFKKVNNERIKEIEDNGTAHAATLETLERVNADITAMQEQAVEMQAKIQRPYAGPEADSKTVEGRLATAHWFSLVSGQPFNELEPSDVPFDAVADYSKAFRNWFRTGQQAPLTEAMNALSVGTDQDGGYWVSPDLDGRLVQLLYETSPMRQLADFQRIDVDSLEGDFDNDEVGVGWTDERVTPTETTTPTIGTWRIPVHGMYAEPRATQRLLNMASINVEEWLAGKVRGRLSRLENTAYVLGSGSGQPRGFLTYPDGVPTAATFDVIEQVITVDAALLLPDGLVDLVYALKPGYRAGSNFVMNRSTESAVRKLQDGQDNYLWQPDFTKLGASLLLGFPLVNFEDMADVGAGSLPVAFGNFRTAYQGVDGQPLRVLRDPYTAKPFVKFYSTKETGGGVVNFEAIKIQQVSAT